MRRGTKRHPGTVCSPLCTVTQEAEAEAEASRCCVFPAPELILINRIISGGKASWIWSAFISEPTECDNWLLNPLCNGADGRCACVCGYLRGCVYWRFKLSHNYQRYSRSTKVKMFSSSMSEWSNPLIFNGSVFFYSISLFNGVNHDTLHLLCKSVPEKNKTPYGNSI